MCSNTKPICLWAKNTSSLRLASIKSFRHSLPPRWMLGWKLPMKNSITPWPTALLWPSLLMAKRRTQRFRWLTGKHQRITASTSRKRWRSITRIALANVFPISCVLWMAFRGWWLKQNDRTLPMKANLRSPKAFHKIFVTKKSMKSRICLLTASYCFRSMAMRVCMQPVAQTVNSGPSGKKNRSPRQPILAWKTRHFQKINSICCLTTAPPRYAMNIYHSLQAESWLSLIKIGYWCRCCATIDC